ncbi:hypothetical protein EV356DRAFT_335802 [Viridothelium virens]|uniref:Uncharacterized protein n=1 Tax=Viridothelium virens TaxID=1048519 RepID=A0A6A6HIZ1_VIRVR|nr:hypothetical protein EV356DRAFT_335802 [Viridothelium virens]
MRDIRCKDQLVLGSKFEHYALDLGLPTIQAPANIFGESGVIAKDLMGRGMNYVHCYELGLNGTPEIVTGRSNSMHATSQMIHGRCRQSHSTCREQGSQDKR